MEQAYMIDKINYKKIFLETYGCQMNEYDTELIKTILMKENFSLVENEHDADVVMLNTCSVRENAMMRWCRFTFKERYVILYAYICMQLR